MDLSGLGDFLYYNENSFYSACFGDDESYTTQMIPINDESDPLLDVHVPTDFSELLQSAYQEPFIAQHPELTSQIPYTDQQQLSWTFCNNPEQTVDWRIPNVQDSLNEQNNLNLSSIHKTHQSNCTHSIMPTATQSLHVSSQYSFNELCHWETELSKNLHLGFPEENDKRVVQQNSSYFLHSSEYSDDIRRRNMGWVSPDKGHATSDITRSIKLEWSSVEGHYGKSKYLWEFLLETLNNPKYNPTHIRWEDREEGIFKFVRNQDVARMWGQRENRKRKRDICYEYLSRALRHYYKKKIVTRIPSKRLTYKFGDGATNWRLKLS